MPINKRILQRYKAKMPAPMPKRKPQPSLMNKENQLVKKYNELVEYVKPRNAIKRIVRWK